MSQSKKKSSSKKTTSKTRKSPQKKTQMLDEKLRSELIGWGVVLVLLLLTLGIYLKDSMGIFGRGINSLFVGLFGFSAYIITIYSLVIALIHLFGGLSPKLWGKLWLGYAFMALISSLLHVINGKALTSVKMMYSEASVRTGGLLGGAIGGGLASLIGATGTIIVIVFLIVILLIVVTERSLVSGMRTAGRKTKEETQKVKKYTDEKIAQARLRQQEREAYRQKQAFLAMDTETESGDTQISIRGASGDDSGEPKEKKLSGPQRVSSSTIARRKKTDEKTAEVTAAQTESAQASPATPQASKPETVESKPAARPDDTIDIPLIANDSYLERKRRFQERTMQKAAQMTREELEEEAAAAAPRPETIAPAVTAASQTEPVISAPEPAYEIQKPSGVILFDAPEAQMPEEDGWEQLMAEAEERSFEDDPSISTDKMFDTESFPTGYEDRNETAARMELEKKKQAGALSMVGPTGHYEFPPITLLNQAKTEASAATREELLQSAKSLEEVLMNFGVEAKVVQVNRGPAVTRFELQPKTGVKVSRIVSLTDDIAMNLAAQSIRIEAPIPGKSAVGIEVPNKETSMVTLREVIDSDTFRKASSKLTFALGKDIDGEVRVADVAKMPHMLIAGATGSGKSVCINSLIVSLIYKADPNDVKLILIDPKVVELSVYNGIPHLLLPVVNDPKQASATLNWAVQEMTRRYKKFAEMNVRDVRGYNQMVEESKDETLRKMPQIVIVIDELADLMMVASKEVEASICRLAQMARAAGMHLVIATQRPSVDVITGLIKANIPSRIAFAVSSGIDSRTILDSIGAEKLLGKGDMLFAPMGASKPVRIQGTFVSDKEVEDVVEFVKKTGTAQYDESILQGLSRSSGSDENGMSEEIDEYLEEAMGFVVDKQKASISMLQRQFRIGFNRAARLMDALEEKGVVGEDEGSKPRRVLWSKEEYESYKNA